MKGEGVKVVFCLVLALWLVLLHDSVSSGWILYLFN